MNRKEPCLLVHYRFDNVVPREGCLVVESLSAYWTVCVVALVRFSCFLEREMIDNTYASIHPVAQTSPAYCVATLNEV